MRIALLLILPLLAWVVWRALDTGATPQPGTPAPDFRLPDQDGKFHKLSDYSGRWLVLYFYPKDDTPGCTREACSFRDGLVRLEKAGASVIGISVDSQESHRQFATKYNLPFSLLSDADGRVSRHYGALMDWKVFHMARRTTFLINPGGHIYRVYRQVDPDRHADEIIAELTKAA